MKAYIDTNIFIYSMFADPKMGPHCKRLIDDVEEDKTSGVICQLVPIEVLSIAMERDPSKADIALAAIFSLPLIFLNVDHTMLMKAADVARKYRLTGYDATHVAAALMSQVDFLISNDQAIRRVKEIRVLRPDEYLEYRLE